MLLGEPLFGTKIPPGRPIGDPSTSGKNLESSCSGVWDGWSTSWKVIVSNVLHLVH